MNKKRHKQGIDDTDNTAAESDSELFRRQMSGTRHIEYETPVPVPRRVVPRARQRRLDEREVLRESLGGDIDTFYLWHELGGCAGGDPRPKGNHQGTFRIRMQQIRERPHEPECHY